jgi:hypothetical protein
MHAYILQARKIPKGQKVSSINVGDQDSRGGWWLVSSSKSMMLKLANMFLFYSVSNLAAASILWAFMVSLVRSMKVVAVAYLSRRHFSFLLAKASCASVIIFCRISLNATADASRLRTTLMVLWSLGRDGRAFSLGASYFSSTATTTSTLPFWS